MFFLSNKKKTKINKKIKISQINARFIINIFKKEEKKLIIR